MSSAVTVVGAVDGLDTTARWDSQGLVVTGPGADGLQLAVGALVEAGALVGLAGFGGGQASVGPDAGQILAAATIVEAMDRVDEVVFEPELPPLPDGAVP